MKNYQQNQLTMYQTVLRFFEGEGAPLVAVKRIGSGRDGLADVVTRIEDAARAQDRDTTEVTGDRTALKATAGQKAEVLRLLVVALTSDAALRGELKKPLSKKLPGKDADLLAYLRKIDGAVETLRVEDLADAGYEARVRTALQQDLQALSST